MNFKRPGVKQGWPLQAFIFSKELLDAVSQEEIAATFADMREMGLARPPYARFDVILPASKVIRITTRGGGNSSSFFAPDDPAITLRVRFEGFTPPASPAHYTWLFTRKGTTVDLQQFVIDELASRGESLSQEEAESWASAAAAAYQLLVVLLATKNTIKETKECKLLKYGIGSTERNRYTTTLKIGRITESTEGASTGREVRPHLRRGHVRRQHYGPRNELIKQVFIEPVFVNADKGWIAERTAYNLI